MTDITDELARFLDRPTRTEEVADGIGRARHANVELLTLHRPDVLNAMNLAAWQRIRSILGELTDDPEVRAVVIRGAGDRAFAAGADIAEFTATRVGSPKAITYNAGIADALRAVAEVPAPVIAMISGLAVGGGCELAAACDVRIADNSARFGIPVGRLGVILGHTETQALVQVIGGAELKYLLFSGRFLDAAQAQRIGLVQQTVEPGTLAGAVAELLTTILSNSEITMRAAKFVTDICARTMTARDADLLTTLAAEAYDGPNLIEGIDAFVARREPRFPTVRRSSRGSS